MAIRPDYNIGTVTLVASSANFTTSGSSLQTAAVQAGDAIITPSGHVLIIASITGQNSGTLFLPCPAAAAGTDLPLRIRFQSDGSRYQGAVRNLIDLLSSGNLEAFAALVGAAGMVPIFTGPGTLDLADPATFGIQDPNGSLGKLAALTLAANKILNTNGTGDLVQSDIAAWAISMLGLSGVANKFPYLNDANSAALADITELGRGLLSDSSGPAMFNRMGYSAARPSAEVVHVTFPGGLKLCGFSSVVTSDVNGGVTLTLPITFASRVVFAVALDANPAAGGAVSKTFSANRDGFSSSQVAFQARNSTSGANLASVGMQIDCFAFGV
ncbi:hypothetical protein ACRS7F_13445 [Brucella anthropi]|uniref:hypothetical protein n=1 Tax=Brucella anthropi TaxID=529 RepID=UPI003EE2DA95